MSEPIPDKQLDEYLDKILKATGSARANYSMPATVDRMRNAMFCVLMDYASTMQPLNAVATKKAEG